MANINMTKVAGAAVLGAADVFAQGNDSAIPGRTLFRRWSTWVRLTGLIGGALGITQNFYSEVAEGAMLASIPLVEEIVYKMVQPAVGGLPAISHQIPASVGGHRAIGYGVRSGTATTRGDLKTPGMT